MLVNNIICFRLCLFKLIICFFKQNIKNNTQRNRPFSVYIFIWIQIVNIVFECIDAISFILFFIVCMFSCFCDRDSKKKKRVADSFVSDKTRFNVFFWYRIWQFSDFVAQKGTKIKIDSTLSIFFLSSMFHFMHSVTYFFFLFINFTF